ncbi:MAG: DUF1015 domain-containing protein [Eubacteriales bacterium]|nr:DUF1015 domain-containing protein [Eubacteriales bacterium]
MAEIRPFAAVRPAPGLEAEIAALPYDVYSRAEARAFVAEHPGSFLAIDRAETTLPEGTDIYAPEVYTHASDLLLKWIETGRFIQDPAPCYYVYAQSLDGRTQTGIVACASIDDYLNNVIKKHENTRADKEQDRISHVDACNAQTGPIFLCCRKNAVIDAVVRKTTASDPVCDFASHGGVRNRVWIISGAEDCARIREAFSGMDSIYIADGHHRCASAVRVGQLRREQNPGYTGEEEYNFFLSVLFPEDELSIMDYNRVVHDLHGRSPQAFLEEVEKICEVDPDGHPSGVPVPASKGEIGMYLDGSWYLLRIRPQYRSPDPVAGLDVSVLQDRILGPVLGIGDPKTDSRIEFVGGIRGTKELEKRADSYGGAAFRMYPTAIAELFDVADAGRLMPPKSTWFEPKLLSGLFIHRI